MAAEQLVTLSSLANNGELPVYFGVSPVERRKIGGGKINKEARQDARRIVTGLSPVFNNIQVGNQYIYHPQTGMRFIKTVLNGHTHFIAMRFAEYDKCEADWGVQLIGGMCIGESSTLTAVDDDGVHDLLENGMPGILTKSSQEIHYNEQPAVYEKESLIRLSMLMEDLVKSSQPGHEVKADIHLPIPEYLLYALQYYESGVLNEYQVNFFIEAVKNRGAWLSGLIKTRLNQFIDEANIQVTSPLAELMETDSFDLQNQGLHQVCTRLAKKDSLWKTVFLSNNPLTWTDLGFCSFMYQYLKTSQEAKRSKMNLIGVENPEEMPILIAAKQAAYADNEPFDIICLYPHPRIFTTNGIPPRLYRHHTNPSELEIIDREYK